MKKKLLALVCSFILPLLLTGCAGKTIGELYSLPRRSARDDNLRTVIEASMEGLVYAAPVSGDNRESVQASDLDGDGTEEYIVFTKDTRDDSLMILIFRLGEEDSFTLWDSIACKGTSFEQIHYADVDDKPGYELIVGTQLNEKVTRTVSLFSFGGNQTDKIKSMIYIRLVVCDLDENGRSELLVVQNGETETGNGCVRLYSYSDGNVVGSPELDLTVSPGEIRRITANRLYSGEPAVFVTGSRSDYTLVTDILAVQDGALKNASLSMAFDTSMPALHNHYVYADDMNADGMLELPSMLSMTYNTTEQNLLRWYNIDVNGQEYNRLYTFHNIDDGWYLELESDWIDRIGAEKNGTTYTFYMWNNTYATAIPVFTIFTFTGRDRDLQADAQNRFALYRGEDIVYAAKLESGSAIYGMTESYLQENFHLIRQNWIATES